MVPPNNQMFNNSSEALIEHEQQLTDAVYLEAIRLIVEEAFDTFLENLTTIDQNSDKSIKICCMVLEENTKLLKAQNGLLKELINKVNDIRTISRDIAVKLDIPLPLKKNKRKNRSPGFTNMEIDTAMDGTQKKITDYF